MRQLRANETAGGLDALSWPLTLIESEQVQARAPFDSRDDETLYSLRRKIRKGYEQE